MYSWPFKHKVCCKKSPLVNSTCFLFCLNSCTVFPGSSLQSCSKFEIFCKSFEIDFSRPVLSLSDDDSQLNENNNESAKNISWVEKFNPVRWFRWKIHYTDHFCKRFEWRLLNSYYWSIGQKLNSHSSRIWKKKWFTA